MRENIDIVREVYDSLLRGDLDGAVANFADDSEIELMGPSSIPFAGTYRGPRGMREFLEKYLGSADIVEFGPDEFHAAGEFVTVLGHERARSKTTGREWSTRLVDTYEVRDGKIRKFLCASDTASILVAFTGAGTTRAATAEESERARA